MIDCVIVRASGRQLDHLREESSRIARKNKVDWSIERGSEGRIFLQGHRGEEGIRLDLRRDFAVSYRDAKRPRSCAIRSDEPK